MIRNNNGTIDKEIIVDPTYNPNDSSSSPTKKQQFSNLCSEIAMSVLKGLGYGGGMGLAGCLATGMCYGAILYPNPRGALMAATVALQAAYGLSYTIVPLGASMGGIGEITKKVVEISLDKIKQS